MVHWKRGTPLVNVMLARLSGLRNVSGAREATFHPLRREMSQRTLRLLRAMIWVIFFRLFGYGYRYGYGYGVS